jgi:perosamine synthetase
MLTRSPKKLSFAGPSITDFEIKTVIDATRNGFYENYDGYSNKLEQKLCEITGRKYAIATHCCTVALHLACESLGLGPEDEVIVTDFSWVATAYAITYTGAKCVFVDVMEGSWCIDPEAIRAAITKKTKAIMLVHTFGQAAAMDEIMAIARDHSLHVIEDAAPALGTKYKGNLVGTQGDIACFSFQGAKLTVSGEGGIFLTDDDNLYEKAVLLASMGRTNSRANFWSDSIGYQYTIANLTAALAFAQVCRLDELVSMKRTIFSEYERKLIKNDRVRLLTENEHCYSNYCYPSLIIQNCSEDNRNNVLQHLESLNIHARPAFPPMSEFPPYKTDKRFPNPITQKIFQQGISLPAAMNITQGDVEFIADALEEAMEIYL